nr:RNA-directed DNA polymerase, eukaryota [Tanacetum cinerariifolium]
MKPTTATTPLEHHHSETTIPPPQRHDHPKTLIPPHLTPQRHQRHRGHHHRTSPSSRDQPPQTTTTKTKANKKGFDFVSHCKKRVGDGHNTQFWYDSWVFDHPLRLRFPRLFALETDKESTVASKLGSSSVDASFRRSVRDGVERQQWDDLNSVSGSVICDLNGDGVFRVKEVRTILGDIFLPSPADATRWVKYIPIKINVFVWRARLDRLPTRRVVLDSSLCPLTGLVPEDTHHVLFRCDTVKLIFRRIFRWWDLDWHDLLSFSDCNAWFSAIRLSSRIKLIFEGVFYVAWLHLWVYRNQSIFATTPPRRSIIFDDIVSRSFT